MINPNDIKLIPVFGFDAYEFDFQMKEYQEERDKEQEQEWDRRALKYNPGHTILEDDDERFEFQRPRREDFGMDLDILRTLLDGVGSEGKHPAIAKALFHACIKAPGANPTRLYMPNLDSMDPEEWYPHFFAAYLQKQSDELLPLTEPDALVMLQGRNRKPYKGYESVTVDTWVNHNAIGPRELDLQSIGREAIRLGVTSSIESPFAMVEDNTKVLQLNNSDRVYRDFEWTTIERLGIRPDEFDDEPKEERYAGRNRLAAIEDIDEYDFSELIKSYQKLFSALRLDVDALDMEDGEHYSYEMTESQLEEINKSIISRDDERITGMSIDREDRPTGYWLGPDYYVNNWGDMTIRLNIDKESFTTTYTMVVFMDPRSPKDCSSLSKYHTATKRYQTLFQKEVAHTIESLQNDPLLGEIGMNDIDDTEYDSLVRLIDSMNGVLETEKGHDLK